MGTINSSNTHCAFLRSITFLVTQVIIISFIHVGVEIDRTKDSVGEWIQVITYMYLPLILILFFVADPELL